MIFERIAQLQAMGDKSGAAAKLVASVGESIKKLEDPTKSNDALAERLAQRLEQLALVASSLPRVQRRQFLSTRRAEIIAGLREENAGGIMSETEIQRAAAIAAETLRKMALAMTRHGAGRA